MFMTHVLAWIAKRIRRLINRRQLRVHHALLHRHRRRNVERHPRIPCRHHGRVSKAHYLVTAPLGPKCTCSLRLRLRILVDPHRWEDRRLGEARHRRVIRHVVG